jgi:hypothetical protein
MTSALDGVGWSRPRSSRLYPRERLCFHCTGGWMGFGTGLDNCGKSDPHRDSIPGPSSPYRVAVLTTLSQPMSWLCVALNYLGTSGCICRCAPSPCFTPKWAQIINIIPIRKKNISVVEGSKIKGVKTKMNECKLRSVVNWQWALKRKRRKINGHKRRYNCYSTIKRHVDTFISSIN